MPTSVTTQQLTDKLAELVSYASESSQVADSTACLAYIAEVLEKHGLTVAPKLLNGFPALYTATTDTKKPKLLLSAHIDVVPAEESAYTLVEKEGKLYGRGVFDMKFAVACYMQLIEELADELENYDFGIFLTSDEELGNDSVRKFLEEGYGAAVCILPDGGNNWQLEASNNGAWFIKLTAAGKPAHGSRPWEGQNAIDQLMAAITEIKGVFGELNPERCSITVSQINGGEAINQVPAQATAVVDMRFRTLENFEKKKAEIEKIIASHSVAFETLAHVDPGVVDLDDPYVAAFMQIAEEVGGKRPETSHSLGSSDAHYFVEKGIPTILMRPAGGGHHGDDEWLDQVEFERFYQLLKAYVIKIAQNA